MEDEPLGSEPKDQAMHSGPNDQAVDSGVLWEGSWELDLREEPEPSS